VDPQRNAPAVNADALLDCRRSRRSGRGEVGSYGTELLPAARPSTSGAIRVEGAGAFDERQEARIDQIGESRFHRDALYEQCPPPDSCRSEGSPSCPQPRTSCLSAAVQDTACSGTALSRAINKVLNRTGYSERQQIDIGLREPTRATVETVATVADHP
jgi:hypothetical protein